jgi:2-polyprenyl-3-methyl-5-hydroxy-6-metoxy-1,4-benzoquinol methylase
MRYVKEVFDVVTFEQAKHTVLTSDSNNQKKFEEETKFFVESIKSKNIIKPELKVLDFGCGMGRISKELVQTFGCDVVGVDISESMGKFATLYVRSPSKFKSVLEYTEPDSIDVVISTFVLQHVENPLKEIDNLVKVTKEGGYLIILNESKRYVPSGVDKNNFVIWNDDGFDILTEIEKYFGWENSINYMDTDKKIDIYKKL